MWWQLIHFIKKDWLSEWKVKYSLGGLILYLTASIFIVFLIYQKFSSTQSIRPSLWNMLYWIIILFVAMNAVVRSFIQEQEGRKWYYFQLIDPVLLLISKVIYNALVLFISCLLAYGLMSLLVAHPIQRVGSFLITLLVGSISLSICLTFVSSISSQAGQNSTLIAILGFPLILPIIALLINLTAYCISLDTGQSFSSDISLLLAIDLLLLGLSLWLFPFLWKE